MDESVSRQSAILAAGFLELSANASASMGDVAKRAGVGRATLHRYYPSRDTLLNALAKAAMSELNAAIEDATREAQSYTEGLRLALEAMLPLGARHMFLATALYDVDPELKAAYAKDKADMLADIVEAQHEGGFDPNLPPEWIAETYIHMLYAGWSLVQAEEATPKQAAALAWRSLTKGLSL